MPICPVGLGDRLREMEFGLLPGDGLLGDLRPLLERHLPPGDPVRAYTAHLEGQLGAQTLRGYLTGSVDVVLRLRSEGGPRYLVVDYKTNWLGPADEPLAAHSYEIGRAHV